MPHGMDEPGTYEISTGSDKKTKVEADRLDYDGPDGSLQAYRGGEIVATFRWWESVVRTSS